MSEKSSFMLNYEAMEKALQDRKAKESNVEPAGGTRFSAGKPHMWMLPWGGLLEVAKVSEAGARKYAPLDYMEGQSASTLLNSALRHMVQCARSPWAEDPETGLPHAAHAAWNLLCLLDQIDQGTAEDQDDVTPWQGVTARTHRGTWSGSGDRP